MLPYSGFILQTCRPCSPTLRPNEKSGAKRWPKPLSFLALQGDRLPFTFNLFHGLQLHPGAGFTFKTCLWMELSIFVFTACVFVKGRSEEHTSELQSRPHLVCR